jgi:hypothetical protein
LLTKQQEFVNAYKTRVAKLPPSSKCVGLTAQSDAQSANLVASDEETQEHFGLEALFHCTGLDDTV